MTLRAVRPIEQHESELVAAHVHGDLVAYEIVEPEGDAFRRKSWVVAPRAEIAPGSDIGFDGIVGVSWRESDAGDGYSCHWAERIVAFDWAAYWASDPDIANPS